MLKIKLVLIFLLTLPKNAVLFLIKIYQATLSPDHSWLKARHPTGFCRFYPSCSEYAYQAIKKQGLIFGLVKSVWRILRCNPLGKGGVDLP
ncbi:MAG: membrane protein insertion efficiency factor YidD [Candidatus Magasanikbacteria bacterium]|nr:membrane protein insertion efficiency factor YidD [Candidatus Magasanikbacteria bacterium]